MGKEYSPAFRNRAVGMVFAGQPRGIVCEELGISRTQLYVWVSRASTGSNLTNKPGRGRKSRLHPVVKRVIAMAVNKRNQTTRKLAFRLSRSGYFTSKSTVHRYFRKNLGFYPYKLKRKPKLTEKQHEDREKFAKKHEKWTENEWKNVLWSDESFFELNHPPNRQNDRVWAPSAENVPEVEMSKHPPKVQVWGMMTGRALSALHVVPPKTTVNGEYYRENILAEEGLDALNRSSENGSVLEQKLVDDKDEAIFMQDGAPPHTAKATQDWCQNHFPHFWRKGVWPSNSPDLNPIENIWGIMKESIAKQPPAADLSELVKQVRRAWANISPTVLRNLIAGMPNRMTQCIAKKGGYIGK